MDLDHLDPDNVQHHPRILQLYRPPEVQVPDGKQRVVTVMPQDIYLLMFVIDNYGGRCAASYPTLAEQLQCSCSKIRRLVKAVEKLGVVEKRRAQNGVELRLRFDRIHAQNVHSCGRSQSSESVHHGGRSEDATQVRNVHSCGHSEDGDEAQSVHSCGHSHGHSHIENVHSCGQSDPPQSVHLGGRSQVENVHGEVRNVHPGGQQTFLEPKSNTPPPSLVSTSSREEEEFSNLSEAWQEIDRQLEAAGVGDHRRCVLSASQLGEPAPVLELLQRWQQYPPNDRPGPGLLYRAVLGQAQLPPLPAPVIPPRRRDPALEAEQRRGRLIRDFERQGLTRQQAIDRADAELRAQAAAVG